MMPSFLAGAGGASLDVSTIAQCSLTKYVGHMSLQVLPALIYILYMYMYIYIYMYMYIYKYIYIYIYICIYIYLHLQ